MERTVPAEMPKTITATIVDRLRSEIRDGRLSPGSRLRQAHLADLYGVSTTPVREAFAALEREGLIQSSAHRGVVVFEPSINDLREIYEIRIPLESLAAERAVPHLDEKDLRRLRQLLKQMAAANKAGDLTRSAELNDEFHSTIYKRAERSRLTNLIEELRASSRVYIGLFPSLAERLGETEREHEAIFDACQARKPKQAAKAMAAHLKHTVDVVSRGLKEPRDDGSGV